MRMWMVDPKLLCKQHLLWEHYEIHRLVGWLRHGYSIRRYLLKRLVDPSSIFIRHKELEDEIRFRGGKPDSPLVEAECCAFAHWYGSTTINLGRSLSDLSNRCDQCQKRIGKFVYIALNND